MIRKSILLSIMICLILPGLYAQDDMDIAILGDSNTWLGGDNCDDPKGWTAWFSERMSSRSCRSYARSGATWTNTSRTKLNLDENIGKLGDNNVIYNQVCRLVRACADGEQAVPHVILIAAGTNDAWFAKERPHAFEKTINQVFTRKSKEFRESPANTMLTIAESVRHCCELLMYHLPEAQIVLLTPLQTTKASYTRIAKAGDIIEECGQRMGINVIRQDQGCCVYDLMEAEEARNTYDGTHTSMEGAKRNGYFIANQLKAVLQF